MKKLLLIVLVTFASVQVNAQVVNVDIDNATVQFLFVKKNVEGTLSGLKATVKFDPKHPDSASISGTVETKTMSTGIERRDHHLISSDFFDAEKYPTMKFVASKIVKTDSGYVVNGNLTIKETTKDEQFAMNIEGGKLILTATIYSGEYGIMDKENKEDAQVDITITIPIL